MTDAEALDVVLPFLDRADVGPDVLAALRALRMRLSEVLFVYCGVDADNVSRYLIGAPKAPTVFIPKMPHNLRLLHLLVDTGVLVPADVGETLDTARRKLERALLELRPVCPDLYRALALDRAVKARFLFSPQAGAPRIITKRTV